MKTPSEFFKQLGYSRYEGKNFHGQPVIVYTKITHGITFYPDDKTYDIYALGRNDFKMTEALHHAILAQMKVISV